MRKGHLQRLQHFDWVFLWKRIRELTLVLGRFYWNGIKRVPYHDFYPLKNTRTSPLHHCPQYQLHCHERQQQQKKQIHSFHFVSLEKIRTCLFLQLYLCHSTDDLWKFRGSQHHIKKNSSNTFEKVYHLHGPTHIKFKRFPNLNNWVRT